MTAAREHLFYRGLECLGRIQAIHLGASVMIPRREVERILAKGF